MNPERMLKVRELFEAAVSASGAAREALLDQASERDPDLRKTVDRMIAADGDANSVFDRPLYVMASPDREVLSPGGGVGGYRIAREIGSGGMGPVYLAEREGAAGGLCALKIMRWTSADLARRFEREGAIWSRLSHPNVAR